MSQLSIMIGPSVFGLAAKVGVDQGFYADHGVELEFLPTANGPATITALASGSADLGLPPIAGTLAANEQGAGIAFLMNNYNADIGLYAKPGLIDPDLPFPENMEALAGKDIGVAARGGLFEDYVRRALTEAGMSPDGVTYVAVGAGPTAAQALQNDQVDAVVLLAPDPTLFGDGRLDTIISVEETNTDVFDPELIYSIWAASDRIVQENPEAVEGVCEATSEAIEFMQKSENEDAVIASMVDWMQLSEQDAAAVYADYIGNFETRLDEKRWAAQEKYLPEGVSIPGFTESTVASCVEIANS